jgi:hypothetical protein
MVGNPERTGYTCCIIHLCSLTRQYKEQFLYVRILEHISLWEQYAMLFVKTTASETTSYSSNKMRKLYNSSPVYHWYFSSKTEHYSVEIFITDVQYRFRCQTTSVKHISSPFQNL